MNVIKIKKGLDINLKGKPQPQIEQIPFDKIETFGISFLDYKQFTPKILRKAGDKVKVGSVLAFDKNNPAAKIVSPVSGTVKLVKRGERRKPLEIIIIPDKQQDFETFDTKDFENFDDKKIKDLLIETGLWALIKQRPYGIAPDPYKKPKNIHISTFDTHPLAPDYQLIFKDDLKDFQIGINILKKLTDGKIFLNLKYGIKDNIFEQIEGVQKNYFSGPHPAGNVGIQIHHLTPINKGDIIWTLNVQSVVFIGRFFRQGKLDFTKIIALAGSEVKEPKYYKIWSGAQIKDIVAGKVAQGNIRFISGNVLTGRKVELDDHLGIFDNLVSVIPEGNYYELFGWQKLGLNKYSFHKAYFSWLMPKKEWVIDTNLHGSVRPFVFTGKIEKVLPMDILATQLLKAILVEDIELMEGLGIYEVIEEDFALCEFVCISKINIQDIISKGISLMIKEFGR